MNSHTRWFTLVVVALGLTIAGCRELTAPRDPLADTEAAGAILILDRDGNPNPDAHIYLESLDHPSGEDQIRWDGRTDAAGLVQPEIPVGTYELEVSAGPFESWQRLEFDIGPQTSTADPRPFVHHGSISVPPGYPIGGQRISFWFYQGENKIRSLNYTTTLTAADGSYSFVRPEDGRYRVHLDGSPISGPLEDGLELPPTGPIEQTLAAVVVHVNLTLGGKELPIGNVRLATDTKDFDSRVTLSTAEHPLTFWAPAGAGTLEISRSSSLPFLPRFLQVNFFDGATFSAELGEHPVSFRFETTDGQGLYDCYARILNVEALDWENFDSNSPNSMLFLPPGQYILRTRLDGYLEHELIFELSGPDTVRVVMEPEPQ